MKYLFVSLGATAAAMGMPFSAAVWCGFAFVAHRREQRDRKLILQAAMIARSTL